MIGSTGQLRQSRLQHRPIVAKNGAAKLRQRYRTCGPDKHSPARFILQLPDGIGKRRLGHRAQVSGPGERPGPLTAMANPRC